MTECKICTKYINNSKYFGDLYECIYCNMKICLFCFKYGKKNELFSKQMGNIFYCSSKCFEHILDISNVFAYREICEAFINNDADAIYVEFYGNVQKRLFRRFISPQIKKIMIDVGIINDILTVIYEFL